MDQSVKDDLAKKDLKPVHSKLLNHVRQLVNMSRDEMSKHYDQWDYADSVYRGEKKPDAEDREASQKNEPVKMVVPMVFAQLQSFVAFGFLLFMQNKDFFSHDTSDTKDYWTKKNCDRFLARDLRHNQWSVKLYQHLLDVGRFGLGVFETYWTEDYQYVPVEKTLEPSTMDGVAMSGPKTQLTWERLLKYQGNKINNVSPYRWFPDVRLPLTKFQEGEFCGHEEEFSMSQLRELEAAGEVSGVDHIPPMTEEMWNRRGQTRSTFFKPVKKDGPSKDDNQSEGIVYVTKVVVRITPAKFSVSEDDGETLGEQEFPCKYVVWYANDSRVIKCEPFIAYHGQFPYSKAEFTPDIHRTVNQGLPEVVDKLQSALTWFINSHITAVRRVIDNRLVIDPAGVDMESVRRRSPYLLLKKGASKTGVDRWVKQLAVSDTTGGHMNDAQGLERILQVVSGVNDNAQGQYNSGRRSATEARAVTAGAAGRLKTTFAVLWTSSLEPLGQQSLINLRQGINEETFARVIGRADETNPEEVARFQKEFLDFKGTPAELVGGEDFFVWDATLASEKSFVAQSLQEFLVAALSSPMTAQILDLDPKALFETIMELRGIPNTRPFSLRERMMRDAAEGKPPMILPQPANEQPNPAGGTGQATA